MTHPGEERREGGRRGAFQAEPTARSRGLRWAKADVRKERKRHGRRGWKGKNRVLESSGCFILRAKAMEELEGWWACLGTEAWIARLRSVGSGLYAGEGSGKEIGTWQDFPGRTLAGLPLTTLTLENRVVC